MSSAEKMMRVAVVGAGISGLASAYELAKSGVEVVVYEAEDTLGGHARTVTIDGVDLDLGFMVFNRVRPSTLSVFFYLLISYSDSLLIIRRSGLDSLTLSPQMYFYKLFFNNSSAIFFALVDYLLMIKGFSEK